MKQLFTINLIFLAMYSYSQESIFKELNKKGYGTFNLKGQYFFMHRTATDSLSNAADTITDYHRHDNSSSIAFTLNYESPKLNNFFVKFSYVQSLRFQEYATFFDNSFPVPTSLGNSGAEKVQNDSFEFLNNLSLNYSLDSFGLNGGNISLGRFPLNMEFMTGYAIRQKEQAYQGIYIDIPNIGNWDFKAGHISEFSNWMTNIPIFKSVSSFYEKSEGLSTGQTFGEVTHTNKKQTLFMSTYYARVHRFLNVLGFSFLQKLFTIDDKTKIHFRTKGVTQWTSQNDAINGRVSAIQPGILIENKDFSLEGGLFHVEGDIALQNPFGAKWIISEPLWEIDFQREKGSTSYYIESIYRFNKGKIYALYLRTENNNSDTFNITDEYNLITSFELEKRLTAGIKLAFFRGYSDTRLQQLLDARLVLNYTF